MDTLLRCIECHTMFKEPLEDVVSGTFFSMCPGCGGDTTDADVIPDHFEVAWYWEIIGVNFTVRERAAFKLTADKGMK